MPNSTKLEIKKEFDDKMKKPNLNKEIMDNIFQMKIQK